MYTGVECSGFIDELEMSIYIIPRIVDERGGGVFYSDKIKNNKKYSPKIVWIENVTENIIYYALFDDGTIGVTFILNRWCAC